MRSNGLSYCEFVFSFDKLRCFCFCFAVCFVEMGEEVILLSGVVFGGLEFSEIDCHGRFGLENHFFVTS